MGVVSVQKIKTQKRVTTFEILKGRSFRIPSLYSMSFQFTSFIHFPVRIPRIFRKKIKYVGLPHTLYQNTKSAEIPGFSLYTLFEYRIDIFSITSKKYSHPNTTLYYIFLVIWGEESSFVASFDAPGRRKFFSRIIRRASSEFGCVTVLSTTSTRYPSSNTTF